MVSTQQTGNHPSNLRLTRTPVATDCLLDRHCVVLRDLQVVLCSSEERYSTRLAEAKRTLRGAMAEDRLDRRTSRPTDRELSVQALMNGLEPLRDGISALGADDTRSEQTKAAALALDDGIAGGCGAWIYSENAHATRWG